MGNNVTLLILSLVCITAAFFFGYYFGFTRGFHEAADLVFGSIEELGEKIAQEIADHEDEL